MCAHLVASRRASILDGSSESTGQRTADTCRWVVDNANGWLGLILGAKLYYVFYDAGELDTAAFEARVDKVSPVHSLAATRAYCAACCLLPSLKSPTTSSMVHPTMQPIQSRPTLTYGYGHDSNSFWQSLPTHEGGSRDWGPGEANHRLHCRRGRRLCRGRGVRPHHAATRSPDGGGSHPRDAAKLQSEHADDVPGGFDSESLFLLHFLRFVTCARHSNRWFNERRT